MYYTGCKLQLIGHSILYIHMYIPISIIYTSLTDDCLSRFGGGVLVIVTADAEDAADGFIPALSPPYIMYIYTCTWEEN